MDQLQLELLTLGVILETLQFIEDHGDEIMLQYQNAPPISESIGFDWFS